MPKRSPSHTLPVPSVAWPLNLWRWAREFRDEDGIRPEDILESDHWIEGYERVAETAAGLPDTRCIYVADREADIVSLMCRAAELEHPADSLIRSKHNRTLPDGGKLWASVTAEKPVQWRLLTNRRIETLAEASELIDWYRARWEIEMFFDILKNACKIEKLQLKSMHKLEVVIALYTVVA